MAISDEAKNTYSTLRVFRDRGVVWVTFDHGDINLLDIEMIREIDQMSHELEAEETSNVVVFHSGNPDFFIAHFEITDILKVIEGDPSVPVSKTPGLNVLQALGLQQRVPLIHGLGHG